eukprot:scaffold149543_cov21-Tisochrysis_lutea.AAC.1
MPLLHNPSQPDCKSLSERYIFACVHPDGISSCFTSTEGYYYGNMIDGSTWELDSEKSFVSARVEWDCGATDCSGTALSNDDLFDGKVASEVLWNEKAVCKKACHVDTERGITLCVSCKALLIDAGWSLIAMPCSCSVPTTCSSFMHLSFFATILNVDAFGASDTISY